MRKILKQGLALYVALYMAGSASYAAAADLVWQEFDVNTAAANNTVVTTQQNKPATPAAPVDIGPIIKSDNSLTSLSNNDLFAVIEAIKHKREEEDAALQVLIKKQQDDQRKKDEEQKQKEAAEKAKEEQYKKDLSALAAKQEKEKNDMAATLEEMKKSNQEQQEQHTKIVADLMEELRKKQVAEKEVADQQAQQPQQPVIQGPALPTVKDSIVDQIQSSTQDGISAPSTEADISFTYRSGALYRVHAKVGYATDIQLQPGEEVLYVGAGDTSRWMIEKAKSGSENGDLWHLFIKPTIDSVETNLVMTTTKRSYQILVTSDTWYNPIVKWIYPDSKRAAKDDAGVAISPGERKSKVSSTGSMADMNFNYTVVNAKKYKWAPKTIWDDGSKTYIRMPVTITSDNVPVVFVREGKKLVMINQRYINGVFILDRLFDKAELYNGKEVVKINKDQVRND